MVFCDISVEVNLDGSVCLVGLGTMYYSENTKRDNNKQKLILHLTYMYNKYQELQPVCFLYSVVVIFISKTQHNWSEKSYSCVATA